jgi:hypothetical protein
MRIRDNIFRKRIHRVFLTESLIRTCNTGNEQGRGRRKEEKLLLDAEPVPLRNLFYLRGGAVGVVAGVTAVTQQHVAVVRPAQAHLAGCSHNRQHVLDMETNKKMYFLYIND